MEPGMHLLLGPHPGTSSLGRIHVFVRSSHYVTPCLDPVRPPKEFPPKGLASSYFSTSRSALPLRRLPRPSGPE
ncbi:Uncharacterized protein HZ326_26378 [Fusarium oxysporum f. sp. albedinis]|nr:Uncharacterized protein HZ326_26378 [Fusarium oxysporum f. sp. albedinis]